VPKSLAPGQAVVAIARDGGFMFNAQELATAVRHNIAVVAIVFSDNAYGNVARIQQKNTLGVRLRAISRIHRSLILHNRLV
jgi:thiamine pyrophosphate-dependent acetolactate synthase large subunit-like protein